MGACEGVSLGNRKADDSVIAASSFGTAISTDRNQGEVRDQQPVINPPALLFLDTARVAVRCWCNAGGMGLFLPTCPPDNFLFG